MEHLRFGFFDPEFSGTVASDLAGHAVLQSGVLKAEKVQLVGSLIEHSGELDASSAKFPNSPTFKQRMEKLPPLKLKLMLRILPWLMHLLPILPIHLEPLMRKEFLNRSMRSTGPTELV